MLMVFICISYFAATAFAQSQPTLTDYWDGKAEFRVYYRENVSNKGSKAYHDLCGTGMVVLNNTWYRFNRIMTSDTVDQFGICVRASTDKGLTWTKPVICVAATPNTPWARYATDGTAMYDAKSNKWRMLFQSLGYTGPWTDSYLERQGADPMGLFTTPTGFTNPAIDSKEIWSKICDDSSDHCVQIMGGVKNQVFDEGTIDITDRIGNTFYITFHGAAVKEGTTILGFRGIATTTDFQNYTAAAPDAIFDRYDASKWNVKWNTGGSVGGGHATYLHEGDYWYSLIESPDISLNCTANQNWPFGILRSSSLTNTQWTNWPDNPMPEFAATGYACEWQYHRLFKDGGVTYCAASKLQPLPERSFRIYKLSWKTDSDIHPIPGKLVNEIGFSITINSNSFNPIGRILINLPEQSRIDLGIYDLQGRLVKTLASGFRNAGMSSINWDGTGLDGKRIFAGLYVCKLTSGNKTLVQKFICPK